MPACMHTPIHFGQSPLLLFILPVPLITVQPRQPNASTYCLNLTPQPNASTYPLNLQALGSGFPVGAAAQPATEAGQQADPLFRGFGSPLKAADSPDLASAPLAASAQAESPAATGASNCCIHGMRQLQSSCCGRPLPFACLLASAWDCEPLAMFPFSCSHYLSSSPPYLVWCRR